MRDQGKSNSSARRRKPTDLLNWLNAELRQDQAYLGRPTKASRARVADLVRDIKETSHLLAASDAENPNFDFFDSKHPEISPRVERIGATLRLYPKYPAIEIAYEGPSAVLQISDASGPGRPLGEQIAVWDIARLLGLGKLAMVTQCRCARWFLATRNDQRACSPACRHKNYEQTESFKEKRRFYMRGYYKLKQSGKVK